MPWHRSFLLLLAATALLAAALRADRLAAAPAPPEGFVSLFNGRDDRLAAPAARRRPVEGP